MRPNANRRKKRTRAQEDTYSIIDTYNGIWKSRQAYSVFCDRHVDAGCGVCVVFVHCVCGVWGET